MEKLLKIASNELGTREIEGNEHNPRILKYASDIGMSWIKEDEKAWCSIFLNWVAHKAKYERSNRANAKSWLDIGFKVDKPEPGDVVVYSRGNVNGPFGHVGLFLGFSADKSRIYTLGGNQGNSVSISGYPVERLLEFRRIKELKTRMSLSVLKRGDKGPKVSDLQDTLKMAGYNCGTSDGFFGAMTENAVKELQRDGQLTQNGIFNRKTRAYLKTLVNP